MNIAIGPYFVDKTYPNLTMTSQKSKQYFRATFFITQDHCRELHHCASYKMQDLDPFDLESFQEQDLLVSAPLNNPEQLHQTVSPRPSVSALSHLDEVVPANSDEELHNNVVRIRNSQRFFNMQMSECLCSPKCSFPGMLELAKSFALLSETERGNALRAILLAITAPTGDINDLFCGDTSSRKRSRRTYEEANCTTRYCIRGNRVCRAAFSAIVQMHPRTVNRIGKAVANSERFQLADGAAKANRKGKLTVQSIVALAFLKRYGELNGMSCPTGRGSTEDNPIYWLPNDTTREGVFETYCTEWLSILQGNNYEGIVLPTEPLMKNSFVKVWRAHAPTLRILRKGSDFCDTCTQLSGLVSDATEFSIRESLSQVRDKHRKEAAEEFAFYKSLHNHTHLFPNEGTVHLTFDFAEKILLPHLLRQPGQLHFVTGLKFDFFGVHSSNSNRTFIYGLPEGHWPNNKTTNEVGSMLVNCIEIHKRMSCFPHSRTLCLHADNCAGQNKNRFMLWMLAFRVIMGYEDYINLYFLVAGHTKNRCDAAFGLVKRKLKQRNVVCAREMMRVIQESSTSNQVVCSTCVRWFDWKRLLPEWFTVPSNLRMSTYHVFSFRKDKLGILMAKSPTSANSWSEFRLLKRSVSPDFVRAAAAERLNSEEFIVTTKELSSVPSAQEGNRRSYLKKNVITRYYKDTLGFEDDYFSSGDDWNAQEGHDNPESTLGPVRGT